MIGSSLLSDRSQPRSHRLGRDIMKASRVLGAGLFALTILIGGCGGSSGSGSVVVNATPPASSSGPRGASLTIARSSDVTSLDPLELGIEEDYATQEGLYAGLVRPSA